MSGRFKANSFGRELNLQPMNYRSYRDRGNVLGKINRKMEVEKSFDLLFKNVDFESFDTILPLVRKCISISSNEQEVLRALEIALCFCPKKLSISELEIELFQIACPAARNIVVAKLEYLETHPSECAEFLSVSIKIMSYFQEVFNYLNKIHKIAITEVKSLLRHTSEILLSCLTHCKISEDVYGDLFSSVADPLRDCFKKCCELLEQLLNFLTVQMECDVEDERVVSLLDEIMHFLSNLGLVLVNLEIKTMAKLWKVFISLIERYLCCLKNNHNIGETINKLSFNIITNVENIFCKDSEDLAKIIKLNCFFLKLVIKFSEAFVGSLKNCQNSLLNLLLILCKFDASIVTEGSIKAHLNQDLMNQLTAGSDPLLSQLLTDEEFIKECHIVSKDFKKSAEVSILYCLIMKKLLNKNFAIRSLWLNKEQNILEWIFLSSSSNQFIICTGVNLPDILINGKPRKVTELYEFVFITTSAFLMTASFDEYRLIEKTLMESVLQVNPVRALLAIDIWCILAKFADSELAFTQMLHLSKFFQEFHVDTLRVEKWFLGSLICRLYSLLTERHKTLFLKSFPTFFYSALLENCLDDVSSNKFHDTVKAVVDKVEQLFEQDEFKSPKFAWEIPSRQQNTDFGNFGQRIIKWWQFNCEILSSTLHYTKFLKTICAVTAILISDIPSENLIVILTQMKKLITMGQPTCVKLYFMNILNSLSAVKISCDDFQKKILITVAEIFRNLLLSKNVLVKQKAMETFYNFSHVTSHGEVIPLTVQNFPELQVEVIDYFKKKPPDQNSFNLNDYINELYQIKFEHACQKIESDEAVSKKLKCSSSDLDQSSSDMEKIITRWKEDAKKIVECFQLLSESQKRDLKDISVSLFSWFQSSSSS